MKITNIISLGVIVVQLATSAFAQSTGRIPIRDPLTGNRTYYVRTDGSDNNSGLLNDATDAFLTIQHAVDVVAQDLDLSGYSATIQVGAGAYNAPVVLNKTLGSQTVTLQGDVTTPGNVSISLSNGIPISVNDGAGWKVRGFKLSTTAGSYDCVRVLANAVLYFDSMEFASCTGRHIWGTRNSTVIATGGYLISGGAQQHISAQNGCYVELASGDIGSRTITITNTPAFSSAFIQTYRSGIVLADSHYLTFSGGATGQRYYIELNSVLDTQAGGANFFPGNSAGSTLTGGQYH